VTEDAYDIVICGGGLVGTTLALCLAHLPLSIALIEPQPQAPKRSPDDRTFTLAQGSKRALSALGVWSRLADGSFHAITEIEVSDRRGRFGLAHILAREQGVEALGYVTENAALLEALYSTIATTAVKVIKGRFLALERQALTAVVTLDGSEGPARVKGRLVIGADGTRSAVRAACGIGVSLREYGRHAIVANCQVSQPLPHTAFERFAPHGPIAALPLGQDRYTFVISRPDAPQWQAFDDEQFLVELEAAFGTRLGRFLAAGRRQSFPLTLQLAETAVAARVAIIGNAAHTLHPVAGQGFNLGLRDAAVLADHIAAALRTSEDYGSLEFLQTYADKRTADTRATVRFTDGLVRLFSLDVGPIAWARNLALTCVDCLPPVKHALAQRTMGLKGPLPRLMRGLKP